MDRPFQTGDLVRVKQIPAHIAEHDPPETRAAFEFALGNIYRVSDVDWGGWVFVERNEEHGGIGVHPDCVELIEAVDAEH